jgi:antitoxin (DNA-binding transcriptional repressor) of toxin-antitoxin stability system
MQTLDIREVQTQLSKLIEQAAQGDAFIIAKAGKPLVKVVRLDALPAGRVKRLGFMACQISVPDDFDSMGSHIVERIFDVDATCFAPPFVSSSCQNLPNCLASSHEHDEHFPARFAQDLRRRTGLAARLRNQQ